MFNPAEVIWDEERQGSRLIAENAELADRLRRLGCALTNMAHELAQARRDNAALRRENVRLQILLHAEEPSTRAGEARRP